MFGVNVYKSSISDDKGTCQVSTMNLLNVVHRPQALYSVKTIRQVRLNGYSACSQKSYQSISLCKAPAKRVQHFIQHHTTLMFYEMLHSFGHLVVSCFIVLYLVVWSLIAIKLFTKQMLYDTTFLLFSAMLYDVVLVWPPHATLLYSVVLALAQQK